MKSPDASRGFTGLRVRHTDHPTGVCRVQSRTHLPLQFKGREAASRRTRGNQLVFEGTIASACDLGIGVEQFIEMVRLAGASDPGAARFLGAWDTLTPSSQHSDRAADAVCARVGLAPLELLKTVADAACRYAMHAAQISAALALPSVVGRSIEAALTDEGDRARELLLKTTGFLATPRGGPSMRVNIQQSQVAQASAQTGAVAAPRPEETIRRMCDRLNEAR